MTFLTPVLSTQFAAKKPRQNLSTSLLLIFDVPLTIYTIIASYACRCHISLLTYSVLMEGLLV